MESVYWADYTLGELGKGGLHLERESYPDVPIADGTLKDVKLISIDDLLAHIPSFDSFDSKAQRRSHAASMLNLSSLANETQKRSHAASMLDELNDKYLDPTISIKVFSVDHITRNPLNPNNYLELLLWGQVILLPNREPGSIESYRTYTSLCLSLNEPREDVTINTDIGKDFVNVRELCLHSKDKETADPIIKIGRRSLGGSRILRSNKKLRDITNEKNRSSPQEHIDRIVPIILSGYRSIVAQQPEN